MCIINHEPKDILVCLKHETAELHQEVEGWMPFTKESFSLPDYKYLLVNFYTFYGNFEPQLERALREHSINFDYRQRLKTPKLEMDLKNLKMPLPTISNIAIANDGQPLDSKEKVFGALYVIEGATLGGQIISRILKQKFDLDETNGAAFFNGYGSSTGAMWNDFRKSITDFAATSNNHEEIVAAAAETFQQFGRAIHNP